MAHLQPVKNELQEVEQPVYVPELAMTPKQAVELMKHLDEIRLNVLRPKVDYDVIPGTKKPSLLKPGAERLLQFFGLGHEPQCIEKIEDWEKGFFFYSYRVIITHPKYPGFVVAACEGSCNSREPKYYKKKNGELRNPYELVNTIQKMAIKRALVGATLQAVGASGLFTQDIEDMDMGQEQLNKSQPSKLASQKQIKKLMVEAKKRKLSEKWIKAWISYFYKKGSRDELTTREAAEMIDKFINLSQTEMDEILFSIKAHFQAQQEPKEKENDTHVYNVDPETGEVTAPEATITDDEIEQALAEGDEE